MKRNDAISRIKSIEPAIRAFGAASLYLFGSTARDDAKLTSDVDILIDRTDDKLGFMEFFDLEHLLEQTLQTKVDLVTRDALHPVLKADIERSAIRIL